jgi:hypothetical protein
LLQEYTKTHLRPHINNFFRGLRPRTPITRRRKEEVGNETERGWGGRKRKGKGKGEGRGGEGRGTKGEGKERDG